MTELKPKFIKIAEVAILEFVMNHPGCMIAAQMMNDVLDLTEEQIQWAYETYGELAAPISEFLKFEFTGGRNGYKRPKWLDKKPENIKL